MYNPKTGACITYWYFINDWYERHDEGEGDTDEEGDVTHEVRAREDYELN